MTNLSNSPKSPAPQAEYRGLLPAMAGIALYMFVLAGVVGFGAGTGRFPRLFLLLRAPLLAAGGGGVLDYPPGWEVAGAGPRLCVLRGLEAHIPTRPHGPVGNVSLK